MAGQLELSQMIKALRAELKRAQSEGEGEKILFTVEDVELELEIVAEDSDEESVGARFYVFTGGLKTSAKDVVRQKMKLKLKAIENIEDKETGETKTQPAQVSGTVEE